MTTFDDGSSAGQDMKPPLSDRALGRPGAGRGFVLRRAALYTSGMIAANALGAVVTFLYALVILGAHARRNPSSQLRLNLAVFGIYLVGAMLLGLAWSTWQFRPTLAWLLADREPDKRERYVTLRQPIRQLIVLGSLWAVGIALFFALNVHYSLRVARDAALSTLLGALFTCAFGYLLSERLLRPVTTMALVNGGPEIARAPGVVVRVVWAWAVGAGVPLLGAGLALVSRGSTKELATNAPALFLLGFGVLGSLATMVLLARSIAAPTKALRDALAEVGRGNTDIEVPVSEAGELGRLQRAINDMTTGLEEMDRLRDIFGRQVGADVARQALARGVELGGESRDVAVLFVDLDGSTRFANHHAPQEVVSLLNTFFAIVVDVIARQGGVVNKLHGDGALCVFGAPVRHSHASTAALASGRELRERVIELDDGDISVGIGISAGTVVAGNVGAESRFEYTVIGDPVNEASRLTSLAKHRPERLLTSERALRQADDDEAERWSLQDEPVSLDGRTELTRVAVPKLPSPQHSTKAQHTSTATQPTAFKRN